MPQARRVFPQPAPETQPFWEGCRRHELLVPRCRGCGAFHFYPRALCPKCWCPEMEWVRASGRGRLYSYVIGHPSPGRRQTPSIIAVVELEEGMRLMCTLHGIEADPANLSIGMLVEVAFEEASEDLTLLSFRAVSS